MTSKNAWPDGSAMNTGTTGTGYVNQNNLEYQMVNEDQPNFSGSRIQIEHLNNSDAERSAIRRNLTPSNLVKNRTPTCMIISYLVIICISLLVAVIVVASRPRIIEYTKNAQYKDKFICRDETCLKYENDLLSIMNTNVNPCDDFYDYVCGNWSQVYPLDGKIVNMQGQIFENQVGQRLSEYLSKIPHSDVATENKHPHQIAAYLYKNCLENFNNDAENDIKTLVELFGGWPLVGDEFKDDFSNIVEYIFKALKEFDLNVLFDINVVPNPLKPESYALVISKSSILATSPWVKYSEEVKPEAAEPSMAQELMNVIIEFHPSASQKNPNMLKDLENVLELENELLKLKDIAGTDYASSTDKVAAMIKDMSKTLTELNKILPLTPDNTKPLSWVAVIQNLLNNSPDVNENYEIGVEIPAVKATLAVLYARDVKTVKNWLLYKVLSHLGPRISAKLRKVFLGTGPNNTYCSYEVNTLMPYAAADIYDANFWAEKSKENTEKVLGLVEDIKAAAARSFNASSWLNDKDKAALIEKFEKVTAKIGFPKWIKNTTALTEYYDPKYSENLATENSTYLDVAKWILKLNWPRKVKMLKEKFVPEKYWWNSYLVQFNAWNYPLDNSITFPVGYFDYPILGGTSQPRYLAFGRLGSVIGHEMFHGLDPTGIIFDSRGQLYPDNTFDAEFTKTYDEKLRCLVEQYSKTTKRNVSTITEDFADNAIVQIMLDAYIKSKTNLFHDDYLPNINLSKPKLLYISYASHWCEETTEQFDNFPSTLNDVHSDGRNRVNVPLQNTKAFSDVFNCPVGSKMNPAKKCVIF